MKSYFILATGGIDMGNFWAEVGNAALEFILLVAVAGCGIFLGMKLRKKKNTSTEK